MQNPSNPQTEQTGTRPASGRSWAFPLLSGVATGLALDVAGREALPWRGDSYFPALCVLLISFGVSFVRAWGCMRANGRRDELWWAPIEWFLVVLIASCVGSVGLNEEPPTAFMTSSELILAAGSARAEINRRFLDGMPLDHVGHGVEVGPIVSRYVIKIGVSESGAIVVHSEKLHIDVSLTPEIEANKEGKAPILKWNCIGEPRRLMSEFCRAPKPWYRLNP